MDQGARLNELIKALKINQKTFAQSLGMTQPNISKMITRANKVSAEVINKITIVYKDVNVHWLLTGEGEMFSGGQATKVEEPAAVYGKEGSSLLYRDVERILEEYGKEIKALKEKVARLEERLRK